MHWVVPLMAAVLLTTVTAGMLMLVWVWVGKLLDKAGYINILFVMLKAVQFFWIVPLGFFLLLYGSREYGWWGGIMFLGTPLLLKCSLCLVIMWFAGFAKGLYDYVKANIRLRRIDRASFTCKASLRQMFDSVCDELHVNKKRVRLRQTYLTSTPFIAGGWKKTVYIPADAAYSQETFRIVFMHELTHYRQGAVWLKQLALLSGKLYFFNPLVKLYRDIVEKWCEFVCDYAVCRRLGGFERYWLAILETLTYKDLKLGNVSCMAENGSLLVARLDRMMKYSEKRPKLKRKAVIFIVCLMTTVGICSVTAASLGAADLYSCLYSATNQEYANAFAIKNIVTESVDLAQDDEYSVDNAGLADLHMEEIYLDGDLYRKYFLDWEVDAGSQSFSPEFEVKDSSTISIVAAIEGDAKEKVVFGIIEPDGTKRCVSTDTNTAYCFELSKSGTYRFYICNDTEDSLGGYFCLGYRD